MKIELIAPCVVRPHIFFIPLRFSQLPHRTNSSQSLYEHEEAEEAESAIHQDVVEKLFGFLRVLPGYQVTVNQEPKNRKTCGFLRFSPE